MINIDENMTALPEIEMLKIEAAKTIAAFRLEKRKVWLLKKKGQALKAKNQKLKQENKQLRKTVEKLEKKVPLNKR